MGIEVTRDEADKQFDALGLKDADPNKRYRFVRERDINMAKARFNGYDRVDSTTDKVRSVLSDSTRMKKGADVDTAIRVGDMVLMSQDRAKFDERMKRRQEKTNRQAEGFDRNVIDEMNRSGGGQVRAYRNQSDERGMHSVEEQEVMEAIDRDRQRRR